MQTWSHLSEKQNEDSSQNSSVLHKKPSIFYGNHPTKNHYPKPETKVYHIHPPIPLLHNQPVHWRDESLLQNVRKEFLILTFPIFQLPLRQMSAKNFNQSLR